MLSLLGSSGGATPFGPNVSSLEGALIVLAVIVLFIVRQFSTRSVTGALNYLAPLALLYFGLQSVGQLDATGWVVLGLSSSVAIAMGFARGMSFQVWVGDAGQSLMRGTPLTVALWLATIAVKIGLSIVETQLGLGSIATSSAALLLPGAATFAAQSLVVYLRSQDQRQVGFRAS